jgi:hypothetical protein
MVPREGRTIVHYESVRHRVYLPERHFTLSGGVLSQAIESVTPEAIWAQAFSVAVRRACASLEAPAVRHADRPWKEMHTSQRYLFVPMVVKTSTVITATTNTVARSTTVLFTN